MIKKNLNLLLPFAKRQIHTLSLLQSDGSDPVTAIPKRPAIFGKMIPGRSGVVADIDGRRCTPDAVEKQN